MKSIIIFGMGKGGFLHYNTYKKLGINNIYFVDKKNSSQYIHDQKVYNSLKAVLTNNNLNPKEVVADIVVPKDIFYEVINECEKENITNIIIEKPFVLKQDSDFKHLNIIMVQNYIYSKIYNYIKNYISENNLKIKNIYSSFTKNRKANSLSGRGMSNQVVSCYNIEMPHQFYMTQDLLNNAPQLLYKQSHDMCVENKVLKDHGSALMIIENKDAISYLYSDMTSDILQKNIIVNTNNHITLQGEFFTYTQDLKVLTPGCVKIYKNDQLINEILFEDDDMFAIMLEQYIKYFEDNKRDNIYRKRIETFSKFYRDNNL